MPAPPPVPRKVHIPVQVRNEAVQWLSIGGTQPLLLRATLQLYREMRGTQTKTNRVLTDAEILIEILRRAEKVDG